MIKISASLELISSFRIDSLCRILPREKTVTARKAACVIIRINVTSGRVRPVTYAVLVRVCVVVVPLRTM